MKISNKISVAILAIVFTFGLIGPITAQAATVPSLGAADSYAVFGKAGVTNSGLGTLTHIWGDVGADLMSNITGLLADQVGGTIIAPTPAAVQTDITAAYGALSAWPADGTKNLSTSQTVTSGVYTVDATETLTGTITLSGTGIFIFRSASAYHVANGAKVLLTNGATACNVFWAVQSTMTIGTNVEIVGTIIADTEAITLNTGATLKGRALSSIAAVTLLSNQITEPTCAASASVYSGGAPQITKNFPELTVIKHVINDNGGTAVASNFSISVKIYGRDVSGSPAFGDESGRMYQLTETGTSTVSESPVAGYATSFSGDCDSSGNLFLEFDDKKTCTITNNDIEVFPPLINITKIPTPLALPSGSGLVTYDYTVLNIGTVAMSNVTVADDKCAGVSFVSGDADGDAKLDINETWKYSCATTLSQTTTNSVTAKGQANGFTAVDTANATVVVGAALTPPLIHVVKKPNIFVLPVGGGAVTYTYTVTNPGTEPLSDVIITDDKCTGLPGRVVGHPGDLNKNNLLESNETWTFTCQTNLTQTTTNTGTAKGSANGFTAVDFSPATVVVVAPSLPKTGFPPDQRNIPWNIVIPVGIFAISILFFFALRKQTA